MLPDSTVPIGTTKAYSARTGIRCTTYKDYYDADGKLVDRVELHRDYYRPFPQEDSLQPGFRGSRRFVDIALKFYDFSHENQKNKLVGQWGVCT